MGSGKVAALGAALLCAGCGEGAGYDAAPYDAPVYVAGADAQDDARPYGGASRVINGRNGTSYVFREANGETDIVHPNGAVTTVIHDSDGTRTIVGPSGVHIDTPHRHHNGRR